MTGKARENTTQDKTNPQTVRGVNFYQAILELIMFMKIGGLQIFWKKGKTAHVASTRAVSRVVAFGERVHGMKLRGENHKE